MAKRSTRVEVTKILANGNEVVTLNKNKMNATMCEKVIERLARDWEEKSKLDADVKDIKFRCVE